MDRVKAGRVIAVGWHIWAHFTGMAVIALLAGLGIVQVVAGDSAVIIASDIQNPTLKVPYKGHFQYTYDLDRKEACPGEVVTLFISDAPLAPAVVTVRRPAALNEVKFYNNLIVDNVLPDAVTPGRWKLRTVMRSSCANREQTDFIAEFDFEVTP